MASERHIVVAGATGGIGRAVVRRFLDGGARVQGFYGRDEAKADALRKDASSRGGALALAKCDITDAGAVAAAFKALGPIDAVVNAAGIIADRPFAKMSEAEWGRVLDVNFKGAFHVMKAAVKPLTKNKGGHIIAISSLSAVRGNAGQANYAASKGAILGLTLAAARELGGSNIRVNAVLPGFLDTDMTRGLADDVKDAVRRQNVLGRISTTEEVASFIHFLTTTEHISGQVFNLDSRITSWT